MEKKIIDFLENINKKYSLSHEDYESYKEILENL